MQSPAVGALPKKRLIYLDLLRGYLMCAIIIDHFQRWPGIIELATGQGRQWASAAEGFFLISGLMIGLVRGRHIVTKGLGFVARKISVRAALLYVVSVLLTLAYMVQAVWLKGEIGINVQPPYLAFDARTVYEALTLKLMYGWTDFLGYYAVFLLASIPMLMLLRQGLWYVGAGISVFLYAISGESFYFSWQIIFMAGVIIGYYYDGIHARVVALPARVRAIAGMAIVTLAIGTYLASWIANGSGTEYYANILANHFWLPLNIQWLPETLLKFNHEWWDRSFDRPTLGVGRIAVFSLWFSALLLFFSRYEKPINARLGWLFTRFGSASLLTFGVQGLLVYWLNYSMPTFGDNVLLNLFLSVAVLLTVCCLVVSIQLMPRSINLPKIYKSLKR